MSWARAVNRMVFLMAALCVAILPTGQLFGQPANNDCVTAQPVIIPAGGTICINSTSINATSSNTTNACTPAAVNEVWFSYVAAGPINSITVTPNGASPIQQAVVTISDAGCAGGTFNACDAAANAGGTATANWAYAAGTQVDISVAGLLGDGTFEICITSETGPPTPGSDCGGATPSCDPSSFTLASTAGNPSSGTSPPCFNIGGVPQIVQNDVWFVFTVGQSGTFEFLATTNGATEIDWAIYNITNGCAGAPAVVCNYFFSGGATTNFGLVPGGNPALNEFALPLNVTAGSTYAIMIDNYNNNGVGFDFTWGGTFLMGPTADFTVNTPSACNSLTTTFTNNTVGAASYSWDFGNGQTSNLQNPPAQTYNSPGTYFVTLEATSSAGCINSTSGSVEVFPDPSLNFTETPESCAGSCDGQILVNPSGNGPFTYSWVGGGAANTITDCAGNYTVTVTDQSNGCSATASANIAAGGATFDATINTPVPAPPYCEMDAPVQLTTVDAGGTFTGSGVDATGLFTPANANIGINTITYTIAGSCGDVQTINLEVQTELDATITPPASTTMCEGDPAIQLAAASGGGSWSGTGVNATGLFDPATAGAGTWTITHTSAGACPNSDQIQLTVNPGGAPVITAPSTDPLCISDAPVQLTADILGGTWSGMGVDASGVFSPAMAGAGNHQIDYALPPPCGITASINMIVSEVSFTYLITEPLCNGGSDGTISFTTVNGGVPSYAYSTDGGSNWSTVWPATGLNAGAVQLIVRDFYGCESQVSLDNIGEPSAIVPQTNVTPSNCGQPNGEATVTATGGTVLVDYSYQWDDPALQTTTTATGLLPNDATFPVYTVVVTDDNGCTASATAIIGSIGGFTSQISDTTDISCFGLCDGASTVQLSPGVVGQETYNWTDVNGLTVGSSDMVTGLCPGIYTVTIVDQDNCTSSNTIEIIQPNLLTASISGPTTICTGESTQLTVAPQGGTPGFLYDWSVAPIDPAFINSSGVNQTIVGSATSDYTVEVSDLNGCVATATHNVVVLPPLTLVVDPTAPVCPGANAMVTFSASGGNSSYSYGWTLDGNPIVSPATTPVAIQDELTFEITLTDGCTQPNASQTVTVLTIPRPELNPEMDGFLCAPTVITFNVDPHADVVNYLWEFNDLHDEPDTASVSGPTEFSTTHYYTESGNYEPNLQITTVNGCDYAFTDELDFLINPSPIADFIRTPGDSIPVDFLDPEVMFEELTSEATSFLFSLGDSTFSTDSPFEHVYQDSGVFEVYLVAYNEHNCTDTAFGEVHVIPHYAFWVPNAFTPNGDGFNDVLKAEAYGLTSVHMSIFNRWGEKVRVIDKITDTWDGTSYGTNKRCQNGSYSYFAITRDVRGIEHKYSGNIMLIGAD